MRSALYDYDIFLSKRVARMSVSTIHLLLIFLILQDDYAQKAGLAPATLSIPDELKKEVSNQLFLLKSEGSRIYL